jgi:hypothetical protein
MENQIIRNLNEIKREIFHFEKICKNYKKGHNHHKEKSKQLRLHLIKFLKTNKISEELKLLIENFIKDEDKTPKKCKILFDELEEKIQDLEIELGNQESNFLERIYDKNSRFDFRTDIKEIFSKAKTELFIIDSWINEDLLEVYLKDLKKNLQIKVLSGDNPKGKIHKLVNDYNNQYNNCLEVRESVDVHDRGVFIDNDDGWVMGQSIKDGAKNKPTYLIKLRDAKKLRLIYQKIWSLATKIK